MVQEKTESDIWKPADFSRGCPLVFLSLGFHVPLFFVRNPLRPAFRLRDHGALPAAEIVAGQTT